MPHRAQSEGPGRALRYPLHLPVRFRLGDETTWHLGQTDNISTSGVVIRTQESVPSTTPVTVVISLPAVGSEPGGCLRGEGHIVRRFASPAGDPDLFDALHSLTALAVDIPHYQIDRVPPSVPSHPRDTHLLR